MPTATTTAPIVPMAVSHSAVDADDPAETMARLVCGVPTGPVEPVTNSTVASVTDLAVGPVTTSADAPVTNPAWCAAAMNSDIDWQRYINDAFA